MGIDLKLLMALVLGAQEWVRRPDWKIGLASGVLASLLVASMGLYAAAAVAREEVRGPDPETASTELGELSSRAARMAQLWGDVEQRYRADVAPIERVLLQYRAEPELAREIALALVREARAVGLEPQLLLAVLLVENPWLDPTRRSDAGAVGLMQVMPLHLGEWPSCPRQLDDVQANICHGARIFAHYLRDEGGHVERALLRYNGCVDGSNTPDCHRYPERVYARAGRAIILAWFSTPPAPADTTSP